MKTKLLLLLFIVALVSCGGKNGSSKGSSEPEDHMTFLNIPIDGKISKFASQLEAKGFELDSAVISGSMNLDSRKLKGTLEGEDVILLVDYDRDSETVISVQVGYLCMTLKDATAKCEDLSAKTHAKYKVELDPKESDDEDDWYTLDNGFISIYPLQFDDTEVTIACITYYDAINFDKYDKASSSSSSNSSSKSSSTPALKGKKN